MIYNENSTGSILAGGDDIDQLQMRLETGSGGCGVGSISQIWQVRATDITLSGIGLCFSNQSILKDIEEVHSTLKPNKQKLMHSTPIAGVRTQVYSFPQNQGWCDPKEKCKKGVLAVITQQRMAGYLPAK